MKDIPGYEGRYAATRDGKIWSYPKPSNLHRVNCLMPGKWLKQQLFVNRKNRVKPHAQYTVMLYKNNKGKRYQVHRLVAQAFIPNPNELSQINHKDGNTFNNDVNNLEWCTSSHNMQHAVETGLFDIHSGNQDITRSRNGKKTGAINGMKSRRMFTMAEANCIRKIHKITKKSYRSIARAYNCTAHTISNICNYKSYLQEVPQ